MEKDNFNRKKGFAVMSPERQKEIASMGGKAAHQSGRAHKWNTVTAKIAGLKGLEVKNGRMK